MVLARNVKFSACGLYDVDLPLLFAVSAPTNENLTAPPVIYKRCHMLLQAGGAEMSYVFLITQLK
jgi:hypothetical protein